MQDPYQAASDLADEMLDDTGSLHDHLRGAIWLYYAAHGRLPEPEQVSAYVSRCRRRGKWVSGHDGRVQPPQAVQVWMHSAGGLSLVRRTRVETGGQAEWTLLRTDSGERVYGARSRTRCVRWLAEVRPDGEWSVSLGQRDRVDVIRAWAEGRDLAQEKQNTDR